MYSEIRSALRTSENNLFLNQLHKPSTLVTSFTFHKNERLKSRKTISRIFQEGKSFISFPLRVAWVPLDDDTASDSFPVQFTQSVPKRKFPKAAHRNRIRRKIREAYRLNKHLINEVLITQPSKPKFAIMVIYVGKKDLPYDQIEKATQKWINIFLKKVKS